MKRYCASCGTPTEYSLKKPIFCSSCGNAFESTPIPIKKTLNQEKTIARNLPKQTDIDSDEDFDLDENDVLKVPNINQLDVEIEKDRTNKGVKLGKIIGTGSIDEKKERVRANGKKVSKKEILENFQKEAGALRPYKRK